MRPRFSAYWRDAKQQLARLPAKPKRDAAAHDAAEALKQAARDARFAFLRRHARTLYDRLTDGRRKFVRIERLVYDAADAVPGLVPTRAEVSAEAELRQSEKDGCEIDQGILCNQFLADPACGLHLCHAMLLPREESAEALAKFLRDGRLDLGFARVERQGKAAVLLLANKRFLNSEDNSTQPATEIAADVCILDPQSQVAVLRGDVVPEGKYAGRRVYNAGINLTHLYYGKIPFLWFLVRDLGFREQDAARPGQARRAARRGLGRIRSRSSGSRRSRPSPSAAAARSCWRPISTSPSAAPTSPCRRARKASSRRWPTSGWRASSATASPARRSCTSAASSAIPTRAA